MVLVRDLDSAVFKPRYQPNYRVTAIFGDNQIQVQDEKGHKSVRRSSHINYVEPAEKLMQQLPGKEILQKYGRSPKLLIAARDTPDLRFKVEKTEKSDEVRESADKVQKVMDNLTLSATVETLCVDTLKTSENCEQLENSPNSTAGVTLNFTKQEEVMEIKVNSKLKTEEMSVMSQDVTRNEACETYEELRKSRDNLEGDGGEKGANTNHLGTSLRRPSESSEYSTKL